MVVRFSRLGRIRLNALIFVASLMTSKSKMFVLPFTDMYGMVLNGEYLCLSAPAPFEALVDWDSNDVSIHLIDLGQI